MFDVAAETLVTWVFEHKIADEISIPVCLFNSTPFFNYEGPLVVKNLKTGEEKRINARRMVWATRVNQLVYPCPFKNKACDSCYKPMYKTNEFLITAYIDRKI